MQTNKKLRGIIVPMVTPFKAQDQLDIEGTQKLIEHLINADVSGIFALGTTGEGPSLPLSLKKQFIETVCKQVNNRIPVLLNIADTSFGNSIELANYANHCGADAAVLMTPYFFKVTQDDLLKYVRNLISKIPMDVVIYNIPGITKVTFEYETLKQLTGVEKIIGMKDSSADIEYYKQILRLKEIRPDWSIMCGPDKMVLESMKAGGDGGVNAGSHILPQVYVQMYNEVVTGNIEKADELNKQVMQLYAAAHLAKPYIVCFKYMLKCMGICEDFISEPFHQIDKQATAKIEQYIKENDLI